VIVPPHDHDGGAANGAAVRLRGVSRHYGGVTAVDGVTLEVAPGTRHAIIGPNGAGKTTLFKMISRQEPVSEGSIELFGTEITRMRAHRVARLGLARTYQITEVFPDLTVIENEMLAAQGLGRSKFGMLRSAMGQRALREKAAATLDRVGLGRLLDVKAAELGHGQQRQLELALALVGDPRLLLLDEPAAGLDLGGREDLVRRLGRLARDPYAPSMIMVTHHVEEIAPGFTHVLMIRQGKVIAAGPLELELTSRNLSHCFGLPLVVEHRGERWTAQGLPLT
jgi:iron complex transport system ATP-binding protein